jgi:hypothetical protein
MSTVVTRYGARCAGFVAGVAIVAAFAWHAWRVPASAAPVAADVTVAAVGGPELAVDPAADVLAGALRPGGAPAEGLVRVRNQTGTELAVRPALRGGDPALADAVHVELTRRGASLYRGPISGLKGRAAVPVDVPSGEQAAIRLRAWAVENASAIALTGAGRWELTFDADAAR